MPLVEGYWGKFILTFVMSLFYCFAVTMYFLLFTISGIWYIFYKYQGSATFLMPSDEDPLEKLQYKNFYVPLIFMDYYVKVCVGDGFIFNALLYIVSD
jgi:hypothetical protein